MASEYGEFCHEQRAHKRAAQQRRWERNYAQFGALAQTHPDATVLQLGDGTHWRVSAYGITVDYFPTTGTFYELRGPLRNQRDHLHALLQFLKREHDRRAVQQQKLDAKYESTP